MSQPSNRLLLTTTTTTTAPFRAVTAAADSFPVPLCPADAYSAYDDDNFDLSLLPQDCGASVPENIPTTVYQYTAAAGQATKSLAAQIKLEPEQEESYALLYESPRPHQQQLQQLSMKINELRPSLLPPPPAYPHIYPSPQSSPTQTEYAGYPSAHFAGCYDSLSSSRSSLYSCSPCPSLDANCIKQELNILPPSPPESNCEASSPRSAASCGADIKTEPIDADENLIDLNLLLEETFKALPTLGRQPPQPQRQLQHQHQHQHQQQQQQQQHSASITTPPQDHQLLRECLVDTSFQKKHNLKPLALESFIGGLEEVRSDIEPVISLALEHAKRDADETCAKLQIPRDPSAWSPQQVHAWLRATIAQFSLPHIKDLETKFTENGTALVLLSEEEFTRRAPESGSILHAHLEIWKYSDGYQNQNYASSLQSQQLQQQQPLENISKEDGDVGAFQPTVQAGLWNADCLPTMNMDTEEDSEDEDVLMATTSGGAATVAVAGITMAGATTGGVTPNGPAPAAEPKRPAAAGVRTGGSHIHLWQFLKELLSAPHVNGTAIRWIDRSKGIFKIEDSVRVAKLWGRRKNRPAMNYDKLSRSIRQYYKKGIMKKTERSQRLVYQFCHPYHL